MEIIMTKFLIEVEAPEGYEDVDPQLCAEDMLKDVNQCWRWSLVESGQPSAALAQRLLAHAELHESHVQDDDQRQWAADLREAARIIATQQSADPAHPSPADEAVRRDAERWRYVRRKLCLTGNGNGTCSMQAINLPEAIPGWPECGQVAEFCDAAIDAAIARRREAARDPMETQQKRGG